MLNNYNQPSIEAYNSSVDEINTFLSEDMQFAFGAKLDAPRSKEDYERIKDQPPSSERYLYRIDEYKTEQTSMFLAFVSRADPTPDWKVYFQIFLMEMEKDQLQMSARFNYSKNYDGKKAWFLTGGDSAGRFHVKNPDDRGYRLKPKCFGELVKIDRIEPPLDSSESMLMYESDAFNTM